MSAIDIKRLIDHLDPVCRAALEAAAGQTLSRTHYNVEIEHWLLKLIDSPRSDATLILRRFEVPVERLQSELESTLDRLTTGNGRAPSLSPDLVSVVRDAWVFGSIQMGEIEIRSGHVLWAMLADVTLGGRLRAALPSLARVAHDRIREEFVALVEGGEESAETATTGDASVEAPRRAPSGGALDRYTVDLTSEARAGRIDPIIGRESEIRQVIDILIRRRQNNPILVGEAGVGKTAVAEGLALRIVAGDVPEPLALAMLRTLDLGLLQAGAGVKGEFENRLRAVIDEVQASVHPVILFVDEAHTLIGAGNGAGQGDAANLLKPALARGALRVVAATTWAEYKKYFEKDAALTRRFQVVKVDEPSESTAVAMLRGLLPTLEAHHTVRILDEAVEAAVRLSARYIPSRQLPDKAVTLIDTACSRVAMSQAATPSAIEDARRRIGLIDVELRILGRETLSGADHDARRAKLEDERAGVAASLEALEDRWKTELGFSSQITALRTAVESSRDPSSLQRDLAEQWTSLRRLQGEAPLVFPVVDAQAVAEILQGWTGIPAGRMQADEIHTVLNLGASLRRRVVGQDHALEAVAQSIRTGRAGLTDPRKPIGVFLMVGTSGVGKTETALALAELLYGGEGSLTTINMSEFKEEHKVSLLMGSPPGYVGYGEGGVLTEAVRRRPYSVVLLDEMEKAHSGVQDVFFQVFDKGTMKDGEGRDVDFKNCVIIMTSNAGTELIASLFADPETAPDAKGLGEALQPELARHFKPAFLGRVTVVPYLPLSETTLLQIAALQVERVAERVRQSFGARVEYGDEVVRHVANGGRDAGAGARGIEAMLVRSLLPDLSALILAHMAEGRTVERVAIRVSDANSLQCSLNEL
jgi:type VI secretion system protein VasG